PPNGPTRGRAPVPRWGGEKNGPSRNAYRHGLTLSITSTAAFAKQLDNLVREIAGDTEDAIKLERARAAAQAELDLAQIRRAKVALIERASALGELDQGRRTLPEPTALPSQEPDRSAEAIRGVLPELRKLDRYERRAAARRDRALLGIPGRIRFGDNLKLC